MTKKSLQKEFNHTQQLGEQAVFFAEHLGGKFLFFVGFLYYGKKRTIK